MFKINVPENNENYAMFERYLTKSFSFAITGLTTILRLFLITKIKKITDKSEMNVFYQSYQNNCVRCVNKDKCPIKSNYELLSEDKCQDAISEQPY